MRKTLPGAMPLLLVIIGAAIPAVGCDDGEGASSGTGASSGMDAGFGVDAESDAPTCDPTVDVCGGDVPPGTPQCIADLAVEMQSDPVKNPPASITEYEYNGALVYYIPPSCCDVPSTLLDEQCNAICHPDGGFTGAGDGKCPDFFDAATKTRIIWQDNRM